MRSISALFANPLVNEFAKSLAETISKRYPPAVDQDPAKRPSINRMTRIIEDACGQAAEFRTKHRLGWLGKARLGNAFRWELQELGYRKEFVDLATEAIVVYMSRRVGS